MFARHLAIWPTLSPEVYFKKPTHWLPFPLDQAHCRTYSLARHAIFNACHALELTSEDTVLVPAYHHGSEIEALLKAGVKTRFYEVQTNLEPDINALETLLTPDVRALYLIHYLGFPQNATKWRKWCDEKNILLIEDAAQAFLTTWKGQPVGSFGHMGVFCLYKTYGIPDGAAVVTTTTLSKPTANTTTGTWRTFKRHINWLSARNSLFGFVQLQIEPFVYWIKKQTGRPDEEFELGDPETPPSKMTLHLLPKLLDEQTSQRRRNNYQFLLFHLGQHVPYPFSTLPEGASPFAFPLQIQNAKLFLKRLRRFGVIGLLFWFYNHPSLPTENFPKSMELRSQLIALPVHQELTQNELQQIVDAVKNLIRN